MKRLLPILSILFISAILISACNSKQPAETNNGKVLTYVDTAGLADFQKWKVQNELKDPSVYYVQGSEVLPTQPVRKTTKKPRLSAKNFEYRRLTKFCIAIPGQNNSEKGLEQKSERCCDRWWRRRDSGSSHQQE